MGIYSWFKAARRSRKTHPQIPSHNLPCRRCIARDQEDERSASLLALHSPSSSSSYSSFSFDASTPRRFAETRRDTWLRRLSLTELEQQRLVEMGRTAQASRLRHDSTSEYSSTDDEDSQYVAHEPLPTSLVPRVRSTRPPIPLIIRVPTHGSPEVLALDSPFSYSNTPPLMARSPSSDGQEDDSFGDWDRLSFSHTPPETTRSADDVAGNTLQLEEIDTRLNELIAAIDEVMTRERWSIIMEPAEAEADDPSTSS